MRLFGAEGNLEAAYMPPGAGPTPVCFCSGNGGVPSIGVPLARGRPLTIELVRKPLLHASLGGTTIRLPFACGE